MQTAEVPRNPALRRALEQTGQRAGLDTHEAAARRITGFLDPLLSALSVPETSGIILEGASTGEPYTRRVLSYPPLLESVGKGANRQDYHVTVSDGQLMDGVRLPLAMTTADRWDNIPIGSVVNDEGYLTVRNARGYIAGLAEVEDLVNLAEWVSKEAPRQALANGIISPNWMNRYMLDELHGGYPYSEGLPREHRARSGLFEVIRYTGGRAVCRLDSNSRLGPFWVDDVVGNVFAEQSDAIAWRDVSREPQPRYYLEGKYPDLYKKK